MSYLLDTNVISEIRRPDGDSRVKAWLRSVPAELLFLSAHVPGELRQGIERLRPRDPAQARILERWFDEVRDQFSDRIIAIDINIAEEWGRLRAGDPLPVRDALMAATARVHDMVFVTRNVADVARTGVRLLNPWDLTTQ